MLIKRQQEFVIRMKFIENFEKSMKIILVLFDLFFRIFLYLRGEFSQNKNDLKEDSVDDKCVEPNQCFFELTLRKIQRKYGRIKIQFWGASNSTLTMVNSENAENFMPVDLVSKNFYDFPVGNVLICKSAVTIVYPSDEQNTKTGLK